VIAVIGGLHRNDWIIIGAGIVVLLIAVPGGIIMGEDLLSTGDEGTSRRYVEGVKVISGYTHEGTDEAGTIALPEGGGVSITHLVAVLTWTDEPDKTGIAGFYDRFTNTPDSFDIIIRSPGNVTATGGPAYNPQAMEGSIEVDVVTGGPSGVGDPTLVGDWTYVVHCQDAGDYQGLLITKPQGGADPGNAWTLEITYGFFVEEGV
jgi:hypothetical protein